MSFRWLLHGVHRFGMPQVNYVLSIQKQFNKPLTEQKLPVEKSEGSLNQNFLNFKHTGPINILFSEQYVYFLINYKEQLSWVFTSNEL